VNPLAGFLKPQSPAERLAAQHRDREKLQSESSSRSCNRKRPRQEEEAAEGEARGTCKRKEARAAKARGRGKRKRQGKKLQREMQLKELQEEEALAAATASASQSPEIRSSSMVEIAYSIHPTNFNTIASNSQTTPLILHSNSSSASQQLSFGLKVISRLSAFKASIFILRFPGTF
jgi:pyruvate/2-oxoglutarate dehydrogenase complex dihydrolipoamide acyltransferase (E2) component